MTEWTREERMLTGNEYWWGECLLAKSSLWANPKEPPHFCPFCYEGLAIQSVITDILSARSNCPAPCFHSAFALDEVKTSRLDQEEKKERCLDWKPSREVSTLSSEGKGLTFTLNNLSFQTFSSEVYKILLGSGLQRLWGCGWHHFWSLGQHICVTNCNWCLHSLSFRISHRKPSNKACPLLCLWWWCVYVRQTERERLVFLMVYTMTLKEENNQVPGEELETSWLHTCWLKPLDRTCFWGW